MVDVVVGGSVLDVAQNLALASLASRACFLNYSSTITTGIQKRHLCLGWLSAMACPWYSKSRCLVEVSWFKGRWMSKTTEKTIEWDMGYFGAPPESM